MCGFLGVRETSALSLIIFLCKAEEFGRRNREGERRGHVAESSSVPVVKALHSLLVTPLSFCQRNFFSVHHPKLFIFSKVVLTYAVCFSFGDSGSAATAVHLETQDLFAHCHDTALPLAAQGRMSNNPVIISVPGFHPAAHRPVLNMNPPPSIDRTVDSHSCLLSTHHEKHSQIPVSSHFPELCLRDLYPLSVSPGSVSIPSCCQDCPEP